MSSEPSSPSASQHPSKESLFLPDCGEGGGRAHDISFCSDGGGRRRGGGGCTAGFTPVRSECKPPDWSRASRRSEAHP
eukprot:4360824-Prymnesium_polylepis.1